MRRRARQVPARRSVPVVTVAAMAVLVGAGCAVGGGDGTGPRRPDLDDGRPGVVDPAVGHGSAAEGVAVGEVVAHPAGRGRFRVHVEAGLEGQGVVEAVVTGAFDESRGAFEAAVDLDRLMAGAPPGLLEARPPGSTGELVIRGVEGLVFVRADERGWILLPGTLDEVLRSAGVVRPDALLDLLDQVGEAVVAAEGERIDGEAVTRYSGWIGAGALDGEDRATGLASLSGVAGAVVPAELLDRLVRFDVWVDGRGRARRLVVEADLDSIAEVARRVDGTDQGIDRLRLRYQVEWFDLGADVDVEAPPRGEVSVIDLDALTGRGSDPFQG